MANVKDKVLDLVNTWTGNYWTDPVAEKKVYIGPVFSQEYHSGPIDWIICIHVGYSKSGGDNRPAQIAIKHHRGSADNQVDVVSEPRRCHRTGNRLSPSDSLRSSAKRLADRVNIRVSETIDSGGES